MSEINYDQSGSDSDEVGKLFLSSDASKLKPYLFKLLSSLDDDEILKILKLVIFVEIKPHAAHQLETKSGANVENVNPRIII